MQAIDNAMTVSDRLEIERLFNEFSWCVDHGDAAGLSGLFASDGVLCVGGQEIKGQLAIGDEASRRSRIPGRKTRHVWSNLRVVSMDDHSAETTAVQLTFEQNGPERPAQLRISDLSDTLRRDSQGQWRFARRLINREMTVASAE
ncbi:nuclear transport factor 2 family protein [Cupriavidus sp. TMH.W2]|uniref:nuclear transport factor 2 family protein n=1 Tax=Cupriavidus sp. TMH.W2 TaxID=3434465 RepID=UPI003D77E548